MMIYKCITLLEHTATFNKDIREWRQQTTNLKTWVMFNKFLHQYYREQRIVVTTAGKGVYTVSVQNI